MDQLKIGDSIVHEEKDFLVVDLSESEVVLEDVDGEQIVVDLEEVTKAGQTVAMTNPAGNLSMMTNTVLKMMSNIGTGDDGVKFFNQVQALYNKGKDHGVPSGAAGKNKSSAENHGNKDTQTPAAMAVKVKGMTKEDLDEILGGEEGLSEDFRSKMATLFEAAVGLRVATQITEIEEAHAAELASLEEARIADFEELTNTIEEQVDTYLSYAAQEWLAENEVAVEASLRTSLAESFMSGLVDLCKEHNMELPEADVSAVEALAARVDSLEEDLNESINANIELVEAIEGYSAETIFNEAAEGLASTQVDKFRTLVEGIEYTGDDGEYESKLNVVKEKYFSKGAVPASTLNEEVELDEGTKEPVIHDEKMARYVSAISKTLKR